MSPLYDVVPVCDVEPDARHLSLRINGKIPAEAITQDDLAAEAASWGMTQQVIEDIFDETMKNLTRGIDDTNALYPEAGKRHARGAWGRMEHAGW